MTTIVCPKARRDIRLPTKWYQRAGRPQSMIRCMLIKGGHIPYFLCISWYPTHGVVFGMSKRFPNMGNGEGPGGRGIRLLFAASKVLHV